jgi:hypothetical protein
MLSRRHSLLGAATCRKTTIDQTTIGQKKQWVFCPVHLGDKEGGTRVFMVNGTTFSKFSMEQRILMKYKNKLIEVKV